jgi:hypothetical protein
VTMMARKVNEIVSAGIAQKMSLQGGDGFHMHPPADENRNGFMTVADRILLNTRTSNATPNSLMIRDENGRAKVSAPSAPDDIARKQEVDAVSTRVDRIIADGDSSAEVVDSRGGYTVLGERLNASDAQLADKASKSDLDVKVDKIPGKGLSTNDYSAADKAEVGKIGNKADISYVNTQLASLASGSPKGVYSNLAALQAAYPSGNSNIYVLSSDGKWYYWNGSAWTAGGVYQSAGIQSGSITPDKLSFSALRGIPSKNLFNKDTVTPGYYVSYADGSLQPQSLYSASDFIPILPNTTYSKSHGQQFAFYTADRVNIPTTDNTNITIFTTPSNARFVRLSVLNTQIATLQLEQGSVHTNYVSFDPTLDVNSLQMQNVIIVSKSGSKYKTISSAVADAPDGTTIIVMPGTYNESVNITGRNLAIVGVNKRTCIIQEDNGNYSTPPVNMSGGGNYLANLSIISTHDNSTQYMNSYAVHCDSPGVGTSEIYNCVLISKQHAAIGIGLHDQQTLILNKCELYKNDIDASKFVGAIYMHNYQPNGATNQKMIVKNCTVVSDTNYALVVEDANHRPGGGGGDARDTTVTFYNTMLWSKELKKNGIVGGDAPLETGYKWGYIKLTEDSYGNNVSDLNVD